MKNLVLIALSIICVTAKAAQVTYSIQPTVNGVPTSVQLSYETTEQNIEENINPWGYEVSIPNAVLEIQQGEQSISSHGVRISI